MSVAILLKVVDLSDALSAIEELMLSQPVVAGAHIMGVKIGLPGNYVMCYTISVPQSCIHSN